MDVRKREIAAEARAILDEGNDGDNSLGYGRFLQELSPEEAVRSASNCRRHIAGMQ